LGEGSRLDALSPAYVARLFDDYAARFDAHLAGELGYRGPELIAAALERLDSRRFSRCIDLGCGTGLAGAALRERVDTLIGVDLSPRMIARARESRLYDSLEVGDAIAFLASQPARGADLVIAADALAYIGDLGPLFSAAGCALAPGGLLAVSVEAMDGIGNSRTFRMSPNSWRRSKSRRARSRPPEPGSAIRLPGPMISSPTRKRPSMLSNSPERSADSIYRPRSH
jgi:predicted TPR repeat methyltransferase